VTDAELRRRRLARQHLTGRGLASPAEVVRWLGAVQAQDYRGALWGIAQRTRGASEADVERAIAERVLVRSWPMRGTLHLVAGEDLRWMLRYLAARTRRGMQGRLRQMGLEDDHFDRAGEILSRALAGGGQLTRAEIYQALAGGGLSTDGQRGIHIICTLAVEGLICLGPHRGKQATFVLLDEWLPPTRVPAREEALTGLARRYLQSHGPATAADFAWWAGLGLGDARAAIARAGLAGQGGWAGAGRARPGRAVASVHLLPPYDEYTVAYKDRSAIAQPSVADAVRGGVFAPVVVVDGKVVGIWRRRPTRRALEISVELMLPVAAAHQRALAAAAERLGRFVGLPVALAVKQRGRRAEPGSPRRARRS
jgi:hypothetical protein